MDTAIFDEETKRLVQIGRILSSVGINTIEQAEKLKEHLTGCPGGMKCIEKIVNGNETK